MYVKVLERLETGVKTANSAYKCLRMVWRQVLDAASPMRHAKTCAHDVGHVGHANQIAHMANGHRPTGGRPTGYRLGTATRLA